jgi:hypothetical protein
VANFLESTSSVEGKPCSSVSRGPAQESWSLGPIERPLIHSRVLRVIVLPHFFPAIIPDLWNSLSPER